MRVKNKDVPYIYREFVEDAVSEYLNLPFRSKIIDRLILDLLIAMELYGFGDEMLNPIFRSLSPLKKNTSSHFVFDRTNLQRTDICRRRRPVYLFWYPRLD